MRVADITPEELKSLIKESVEEALLELFGDPDADLELRSEVKERILASRADPDKGVAAEDIAEELGMNW